MSFPSQSHTGMLALKQGSGDEAAMPAEVALRAATEVAVLASKERRGLIETYGRGAMSGFVPSVDGAGDPDKAAAQLALFGAPSPSTATSTTPTTAGGFADAREGRGVGCLLGLAVGDALGAPLEFSSVRYGSSRLRGMVQADVRTGRYNRFLLKPGQWTDDASMALCLADSLLARGGLDARDLRLRFLCWWQFGYCNAFGSDPDRDGSVGLGGNISQSFVEFVARGSEYTAAGDVNTSGNGSAMRLAAVPIFYWRSPAVAMQAAWDQSKTTHQGHESAACCALLTHVITSFIAGNPDNCGDAADGGAEGTAGEEPPAAAMETEGGDASTNGEASAGQHPEKRRRRRGPELTAEELKAKVLTNLGATFKGPGSEIYSVRCLAGSRQEERCAANEGLDLGDRNWNWLAADFRYAPGRAREQPGYVGSYVMDGVAMALHCVWATTSFEDALLKAANLCGDADTVAAITGQLAGSLYGARAIPADWLREVQRWDNQGDIAARAAKLFKAQRP